MQNPVSLTGKRALVTGSSRGIGWAIARAMLDQGASVIGTSRSGCWGEDEGPIDGVDLCAVDFADPMAIAAFLASLEQGAAFDIVVNNAGTNRICEIANIEADAWDEVRRVNLEAPMTILGKVLPRMADKGWGRVVNVGSLWSILSRKGRAMYAITKHGLQGLTRTAALEYAAHGVLVNTVSPGFVWTDLSKRTLGSSAKADIEARIPVGRFASEVDIANVVLFLCSPLNTYVTGQNIVVDGGYICE